MCKYEYSETDKLRECLSRHYCHDAEIISIMPDINRRYLELKLENNFFHEGIVLSFSGVAIALFVNSTDIGMGEDQSILSISVEEDISYLSSISNNIQANDKLLYILIEMLSGSTLHIASKEVGVVAERKKLCS